MDELVKLVSKRVGIPEDQAKEAVNTVLGYLKQNLPAPVAGQIDAVLAGGDLSSLTSAMGSLGGLLGGKKK